MMDTNYPVEALELLLDKNCLSERYYPLIPYKEELLAQARIRGCRTRNDLAELSDAELEGFGFREEGLIRLLRRFLALYDPDPKKFREIGKPDIEPEKRQAFRELYYLPGVKHIRASLYYEAGFRSLEDIAAAQPEEILEKTAEAISANKLSCTVPLPKEARTHIAVARAFTQGAQKDK